SARASSSRRSSPSRRPGCARAGKRRPTRRPRSTRGRSRAAPARASRRPRPGACRRPEREPGCAPPSVALLHGAAAEKEAREEPVPLVAFVERELRIDDLVLELVERAVHKAAGRDAISGFQDLLALFREHEL